MKDRSHGSDRLTRAEKDIRDDLELAARKEKERQWLADSETCGCKDPLLVRKYGLSWYCARCSGWFHGSG